MHRLICTVVFHDVGTRVWHPPNEIHAFVVNHKQDPIPQRVENGVIGNLHMICINGVNHQAFCSLPARGCFYIPLFLCVLFSTILRTEE